MEVSGQVCVSQVLPIFAWAWKLFRLYNKELLAIFQFLGFCKFLYLHIYLFDLEATPMELDMLVLVYDSTPRTRRFRKIHEAVISGEEKPPLDLRYLIRCKFGQNKSPQVISDVISFLEQIYMSVAENLPDVRDDTLDDQRATPDSKALSLDLYGTEGDDSAKGTKTKKYQRGVPICPGRGCEERFLPAGTMKGYWIQYTNQLKDLRGMC